MRVYQTTAILLTAMGISISASAGHHAQAATYQMENCVKVYRHGPTGAQKQATQIRYQNAVAMQRQEAQNKAALRQQRESQSAFERGFAKGQKQSAQQTHRHNHRAQRRSRYGRRYSTGFYGTQFGSYNRPLHLRRRTRPHKH